MTEERPHLDAVRAGVLARMRSYPEPAPGPTLGLRPTKTHTLHWIDDYTRGAELAEVSLVRVCGYRNTPAARLAAMAFRRRLAAMVLREMDEGERLEAAEIDALSGPEREAWDALLVLLDNLLRTGDPDTEAKPWEPIA